MKGEISIETYCGSYPKYFKNGHSSRCICGLWCLRWLIRRIPLLIRRRYRGLAPFPSDVTKDWKVCGGINCDEACNWSEKMENRRVGSRGANSFLFFFLDLFYVFTL